MSTQNSDVQQTINWYDQNAQDYAVQIEDSASEDLIQKFVDRLDKTATILDVGCAAGRDSRLFKDKGLAPIGIDLSQGLLKVARENNPDIEFVHANMLELPFDNQTFDGIWAHASLLHLETTADVKQALSEFYRVLKPGGYLHVYVKQQLDEHKTALQAHKYSGDFKRFFQFFTKREIEDFLNQTNFLITTIEDNQGDTRKGVKWILALAQKAP